MGRSHRVCRCRVTGKKDVVTRERLGIPKDAGPEVVRQKAGEFFKRLYGTVKPGGVHSVHIDERDKNFARVSYKHDDLDGFYMRRVDGEWYYTLDFRAEMD